MRRCPKCGFPLNEKDKYCENCGEDCSAVEDSEVNEVVSPDEEKEKLKRKWEIGGIVFGVVALVFAAILALVLFVPHSSSSSNTNTKTKSSLTEPTTVDNSIDGKGYYYFDNKFNEETVDKFMSAFDDVGSMGDLGIGVEFDDFKYQQDYLLLGKKVSQYMQVDFNGKTGTILFLDDENNVVAYSLTFVSSLLNDITTDDVYKKKQTVGRLASWLYALSDYKSYNSCEKVAKYFISEMLDEDNKLIPCLYYNGYTMLCNGNANQIALNFFVTDSDFIERHGIDKGTSSIFQAVTEPSTTIQNTTEPESIDDGSSDADDDYDDYYDDDDYILPAVAHGSLQIPIWQDLMLMSLNSHEMRFMPERDEGSIRTTYKIILTINGGMWERLNPRISPKICSMMLKSIMLISLEIMRKIIPSST